MDYSLLMGGNQTLCNFESVTNSVVLTECPATEQFVESLSFQQFRNNVIRPFMRAHIENRKNVWLIEPGETLCLLFETAQSCSVRGELRMQNLNRNLAS